MHWVELLITVVVAVIASSGFWAFVQNRFDKRDAMKRMILGLGHDRLMHLGMKYVERGWITKDEFEDYTKYIYEPYRDMCGNGTGERMYQEVCKLPMKSGKEATNNVPGVFLM